MTDLAPFDFAEASETGLDIRPDCPFEAWQQMGETLDRMSGAWQWWYGDWWNFGESRYGEKHAQALPDKDYDTKSRAAGVAGRIEFRRRRRNLSFSHHREVAYLEPAEQDAWLDRAESAGLSVQALRREIRSAKRPGHDAPPDVPEDETAEQMPDQTKMKHPDRTREAVKKRREQLAEMAITGHTSHQIASTLGITLKSVKEIAAELGVEITADTIGRSYSHDANRIVSEMVYGLEAYAMSISLVDRSALNVDETWVSSLTESLRTINRFLKEMKQT